MCTRTACMVAEHYARHSFASNWPAHQVDAWVAVSMLLVYMVVFGLSWGPVPWAMPAEIFPSSLRAKGVALSTLSNWFFVSLPVSQRGARSSHAPLELCRGPHHATWVQDLLDCLPGQPLTSRRSARRGHLVWSIRLLLCLRVPVHLLGAVGLPGDGGCAGACCLGQRHGGTPAYSSLHSSSSSTMCSSASLDAVPHGAC